MAASFGATKDDKSIGILPTCRFCRLREVQLAAVGRSNDNAIDYNNHLSKILSDHWTPYLTEPLQYSIDTFFGFGFWS